MTTVAVESSTFHVQEADHFPSLTTSDLLLQAAYRYPESGLRFVDDHGAGEVDCLSYFKLLQEAKCILAELRVLGRRPGDKVVLLLERARDFVPAFWACVLGGVIPCPVAPIRHDPMRWQKTLEHIDALLDSPLFITTHTLKAGLPDTMEVVTLDALRHAHSVSPLVPVHPARVNDPAVFVLTSGSTGNSKAVVLTHGNLLASMAGKNGYQRLGSDDVTLNWISFDHVAALLEAHLLPLSVGAAQIHVDSAPILSDPLLFLRLISDHRVSMTFAPNFLFGQINAALQAKDAQAQAKHSFNLSRLRHIISGGEAVVVETGHRFIELLAPYGLVASALWPAFGMSETCAGSIYSRNFPDGDQRREFASLGYPVAGLQIRVVDESGAPLPDGETGELQLRGPMVFGHYHKNEEATRQAFTEDGWFRSGDLGQIHGGQLRLVGRSKDSIVVSGANYFSHELEVALEQLDGIERSFVAAFPTRPKGVDTELLVVIFATTIPLNDEARLHQLNVAIRNTTILLWGFRPALILPLPKTDFPKTSLGKIQRATLRKRLENGEFSETIAYIEKMTERQMGGYTPAADAIESAIIDLYADLFGIAGATIGATTSFFDLGGTSLDIIKLQQRLHRQFGAQAGVSLAVILQNPSPRALAARIDPARRAHAEYDPVVPLQTSGSKTPLFCIHPGVGEVLVFVNLANYFVNDRPFYALRARGFNPGETHFQSFDELVRTYVTAIRKRQPHGPYAIVGYSYGGPVALPVAQMLEAQGEQVAFLGSIDAPPVIKHPRGKVDAVESALMLAFFLSLIDRSQIDALPERLRAIQPHKDPCDYLFEIAPKERLKELDLDLPRFKAWAALALSLSDIGQAYTPSGSVDSITVFYADPLWGSKQAYLEHELKRWDQLTRSPNRYIEVAGEHHTMLDPRHVASFQAVLRAELDRVLGDAA
ncbi:AMP-binding protein [Ralstonia nicotianae]|uniref:Non-ribosomal peptide synthetase n=1 Tax=Ralstonia solanacearum TaxID=305 RepID=A0A0S4WP55_RALSL|nr:MULTISPECIES: non-ribosomal peptide synthetase [Ralstonia]ARS58700.1 peptide synthetase [Ralstonia solanacearum FJAT-91]AXV72320.1 peptide synthetase [Ralstonia solanacearum]ESS49629.1 putative peptide synthase protein [Ralstonia solanacearum SD54]AGH87391.1 macromolecule metabolism; macromolecule synthesis, modification; proteins and peptides - translation and modification [Ralstonia pseudosolanacearum FQY_4]AST89146.1 peptide synthetase [Ralstonia pseudosolanacearum]